MTSPASGAPPGKRSGPEEVATSRQGRSNARVPASTSTATSVQARTDEAAARDWYALGFNAGVTVGRLQLDHEIAEQDRLRMARMHSIATTPAYRDLERIRWDGAREDFGRPRPGDFPGMGADYEPAQYYVPLHPGGASAHRRERGAA